MHRVVLQRRSARVGYLPGGGLACLPIMPMQAIDGVALYAMALKANLRELSEKSGRRCSTREVVGSGSNQSQSSRCALVVLDEVMDVDSLNRTRICLSSPSLLPTLHFFLHSLSLA